ncbi:hypothetical protein [Pseudanabaena sp. CCNP1317]|uniref:hypothetical protein n=1 Tax=Pseudanabaena sp. CCNP1317 TaxID=3110253 RepID=UPI003A4C666A
MRTPLGFDEPPQPTIAPTTTTNAAGDVRRTKRVTRDSVSGGLGRRGHGGVGVVGAGGGIHRLARRGRGRLVPDRQETRDPPGDPHPGEGEDRRENRCAEHPRPAVTGSAVFVPVTPHGVQSDQALETLEAPVFLKILRTRSRSSESSQCTPTSTLPFEIASSTCLISCSGMAAPIAPPNSPPAAAPAPARRGNPTWRRLRRNKNVVFGTTIIALLVVLALIGPWVTPMDPYAQDIW